MDELHKPVALPKKAKSTPFGRPLLRWTSVVASVVAILLFSWIVLVEDPHGGEPMLVAKVDAPKNTFDVKDVAVLQITEGEELPEGLVMGQEQSSSTFDERPADIAQLTELGSGSDTVPTNGDIIIRQVAGSGQDIEPRLSHLPSPDLVDSTVYGDLPKRSIDGRTPLEEYKRPLGASGGFGTARVAIVVGGLGLSQSGTQDAIARLPGSVTLAFAPYGNSLQRWVEKARRDGHELMIQAPLEPFDYPINDPGPHTLRVDVDQNENRKRLHWVLGRISNYVGVMNFMGARFAANRSSMRGFMEELNKRGLMYLDDGSALRSEAAGIASSLNMPFVKSGLLLDANPEADAVQAQLLKLEQAAREKGVVIATASAYPASVRRIAEWVRSAEKKGIDVVPISALAAEQTVGNTQVGLR
ncbi:MAG: divergent polysaccharide deacetylase family protein [Pseudomonadota bacterium]